VKGLVHPSDGTIGFLRYVPDASGKRFRGGVAYSKVYGIAERIEVVRRRFPHYLHSDPFLDEMVCLIPDQMVAVHYKPTAFLSDLRQRGPRDAVESDALALSRAIQKEAEVPWQSFGVSGSILLGLHNEASDLDLVFYGGAFCRRVYETLSRLMKAGGEIRGYNERELLKLYDFRVRDTKIGLEDFLRNERNKTMQGKFRQRDYFLRFVKDWSEVHVTYGDEICRNVGYGRFRFVVTDSSESIFTPNSYLVKQVSPPLTDEVMIRQILSFRGRFCEQAAEGDLVEAQGKIESVVRRGERFYRLVIGGKEADYMVRLGDAG
jgi:predicted nucleotidyltransferase